MKIYVKVTDGNATDEEPEFERGFRREVSFEGKEVMLSKLDFLLTASKGPISNSPEQEAFKFFRQLRLFLMEDNK